MNRTSYIHKRKRIVDGKKVISKNYCGTYCLTDSERKTICLFTTDRQVAQAKLARIFKELEMESEGLIPAKAVREGLNRPEVPEYQDFIHGFVTLRPC